MLREIKVRQEMTLLEAKKKYPKSYIAYEVVEIVEMDPGASTVVPHYEADTEEEVSAKCVEYVALNGGKTLSTMMGSAVQVCEVGDVVSRKV